MNSPDPLEVVHTRLRPSRSEGSQKVAQVPMVPLPGLLPSAPREPQRPNEVCPVVSWQKSRPGPGLQMQAPPKEDTTAAPCWGSLKDHGEGESSQCIGFEHCTPHHFPGGKLTRCATMEQFITSGQSGGQEPRRNPVGKLVQRYLRKRVSLCRHKRGQDICIPHK